MKYNLKEYKKICENLNKFNTVVFFEEEGGAMQEDESLSVADQISIREELLVEDNNENEEESKMTLVGNTISFSTIEDKEKAIGLLKDFVEDLEIIKEDNLSITLNESVVRDCFLILSPFEFE